MIEALDRIREDVGPLAVGREQRADGIVRADLLQIDHRRLDVARVDDGGVAVFGHIALGVSELFEELALEGFAEQFFGELNHSAGVLNDLHGFDAG